MEIYLSKIGSSFKMPVSTSLISDLSYLFSLSPVTLLNTSLKLWAIQLLLENNPKKDIGIPWPSPASLSVQTEFNIKKMRQIKGKKVMWVLQVLQSLSSTPSSCVLNHSLASPPPLRVELHLFLLSVPVWLIWGKFTTQLSAERLSDHPLPSWTSGHFHTSEDQAAAGNLLMIIWI